MSQRDGRELRDRGIKLVLDNSGKWKECALSVISGLRNWEGIAEDFRRAVIPICGKPHHSNCWGAITNAAERAGYLEKTGKYRQPKSSKSHARKTQVFRSK
jgi:hypothetical protein